MTADLTVKEREIRTLKMVSILQTPRRSSIVKPPKTSFLADTAEVDLEPLLLDKLNLSIQKSHSSILATNEKVEPDSFKENVGSSFQ